MLINLAITFAAVLVVATGAAAETRSAVYGTALEQQAMTTYVRADGGMNTYESQAADSKETKGAAVYTIGGWAGERRVVGASITSSTNDVKFGLNDSRSKALFHDARMMARMGWLTPSVGVSLTELDVDKAGERTVSVYGTGLNYGVGLQIPAYLSIVLYGDAMATAPIKSFDKLATETKLGRRIDADAGVSFDLTEQVVDLLIGYRLRAYELDAPEGKLKEQSQGAYAGLRLGVYF